MSKRALRKKREFYNIGLDDDIKAILSLMRNIRETPDSIANDISALNSFINSIAEKNKLSFTKIIELIEEKHSQPMQVPLAIFSNPNCCTRAFKPSIENQLTTLGGE